MFKCLSMPYIPFMFQEHFTWLEEVVSAACDTFATTDPSLLPKTPGVRRTKKRALQPALTGKVCSLCAFFLAGIDTLLLILLYWNGFVCIALLLLLLVLSLS